MRALKVVCGAAILTLLLAPGARADEWNKKTILTFSGPVQVPGVTLPTGSYVFKLADISGNRHVVQVFDKDERKIFTTILAVPNQRMEPSDTPVVLFAERAAGAPQAVKVWFYPGETIGNEFVYPKSQAMRIAKATRERVLAMNEEPSGTTTAGQVPESMKRAELGYFDEKGEWHTSDRRVATSGASAQSTAAARTEATRNTATGSAGARSSRRRLPQTASSLMLLQLISGASLVGGLAVRSLRR
jgi:hypothetical protein